ncbi:unnamed protein product [Orchesella dallaii]|uniref:HAT C-terminal dimerisation domain-containing protein n=1 Tax=Orchesella dallaii TaxID=48710 RepID=A0ABP1RVB8_9HEXA
MYDNASDIGEPSPPKLFKAGLSLSDLEDSDDEPEVEVEVDELTTYLQTRTSKQGKSQISALKYWENVTEFLTLREIALWILAIPASSGSEERTFSVSGQVKTDKGSQFGGKYVDDFTMIHKNFIL